MRERSGVAHDQAVMPMRFGFADTLRASCISCAWVPGLDIVLLPWLPVSGRMYEHVMPHLARAGFRAIASISQVLALHKKTQLDRPAVRGGRARSLRSSPHTVPLHRGRWALLRIWSRWKCCWPRLRKSPAQCSTGVSGLAPEELRAQGRPRALAEDRHDGGHRSFAFDVSGAHTQGVGPVVRAHSRNVAAGL